MIVLCYRFIAIPALCITLISSIILWSSGTALALLMAIWTKGITTGLLLLYVYFFRSHQFFFFNNLGLSNRSIYLRTIILDFLLAIALFLAVLL